MIYYYATSQLAKLKAKFGIDQEGVSYLTNPDDTSPPSFLSTVVLEREPQAMLTLPRLLPL